MVTVGETVSHYRILEKLGSGGMGVVYRAHDERLDRDVALKVLPPECVADPNRKRRFIQEARAASALNHPNIITIYDIDEADGVHFIAMEYVKGKTLDQLIARHGLRVGEALKHAVEMAAALAKAHSAGIVHRDLKPSNVMVTDDGLVKVLDFGLAKLTELAPTGEAETVATAEPRTEEGTVVGTVGYMSPEQAEGKPVDARSDIFSFGSVLYEMLTGARAFQGETKASTIAAILREEPKPLSQGAQNLPRELERVVKRCLRKDREHRFQTMADLKVALEELKEESDSGELGRVAAVDRKRQRWWPWAAGAAAVLLSLGLVWWLREGAPPEDLTPVPLISTGNSCCQTFSPDGTKVAFSWTGERDVNSDASAGTAHWEIYVKQIGAPGNPIKLTTTPVGVSWGAIDAEWSPDDRWIAYRRGRADGADLVLIPPLGGPERTLADLSGTAALTGWSPDGKWLAFPQTDSPITSSLWAIAVDTGERHRLTAFTTKAAGAGHSQGVYGNPLGDKDPSFSPDGRSLAFWRQVNSRVYELCVQPLTRDMRPDGEVKIVTDRRYPWTDAVTWTPDGRELVYAAGLPLFLWRVAASGRQAPQKLPYPAAAHQPTIARTPPRLAYPWEVNNTNLWRLDVQTGKRKALISSASSVWGQNIHPQYSPDGHRLAFDSDRTGDREVWACDADGSNCQQLTNFGGPIGGTPRWSPDGRWIAMDSRASGNPEIYVMAADGGAPQRLTTSPYDNMLPSWSRDGRWIYFASDRSGRYEVWKMPRDGGEAIQVTRAGGYVAFESPDGKYLYYTKFSAREPQPLYRMPAGGGEEVQVLPGVELFCMTSKGIYFVPPESGGNTIHFLNVASGKVSTLVTPDKPVSDGLAVSPDDAYVVWSQLDRNTFNLMLVEGFR